MLRALRRLWCRLVGHRPVPGVIQVPMKRKGYRSPQIALVVETWGCRRCHLAVDSGEYFLADEAGR